MKQLSLLPEIPSEEAFPTHKISEAAAMAGNDQLLAAILGGQRCVPLARQLIARFGSLLSAVAAPEGELLSIRGIGAGRIEALRAAFELGRRLATPTVEERPSIHSPADAAALVQYEMSVLEQEEMRVILLDTRNRVIGIETVYRGSINSAQVRVGELFKAAVRRNAAAIIIVHNHPSGDPTPSPDDVAVTRAIVQAGKLMDCDVLDHMVIGRGRWVSLKERGLGFN